MIMDLLNEYNVTNRFISESHLILLIERITKVHNLPEENSKVPQ